MHCDPYSGEQVVLNTFARRVVDPPPPPPGEEDGHATAADNEDADGLSAAERAILADLASPDT